MLRLNLTIVVDPNDPQAMQRALLRAFPKFKKQYQNHPYINTYNRMLHNWDKLNLIIGLFDESNTALKDENLCQANILIDQFTALVTEL